MCLKVRQPQRKRTPKTPPQAEQLEHWQRNRRQLAYSTVGTPDYIAPGAATWLLLIPPALLLNCLV